SGQRCVGRRLFGQVDAALELLKSAWVALAVQRDDFTVDDERHFQALRPLLKGCDDLWKLRGLFISETRPEAPRASRFDLGDRSNAVVLGFVDQLRIVERGIDQRR